MSDNNDHRQHLGPKIKRGFGVPTPSLLWDNLKLTSNQSHPCNHHDDQHNLCHLRHFHRNHYVGHCHQRNDHDDDDDHDQK